MYRLGSGESYAIEVSVEPLEELPSLKGPPVRTLMRRDLDCSIASTRFPSFEVVCGGHCGM